MKQIKELKKIIDIQRNECPKKNDALNQVEMIVINAKKVEHLEYARDKLVGIVRGDYLQS